MIATCIAVVGRELGLSALLLLLFRSVKLTIEDAGSAGATIDMILARNRAGDRKVWLTEEGDKAEILELGAFDAPVTVELANWDDFVFFGVPTCTCV